MLPITGVDLIRTIQQEADYREVQRALIWNHRGTELVPDGVEIYSVQSWFQRFAQFIGFRKTSPGMVVVECLYAEGAQPCCTRAITQ